MLEAFDIARKMATAKPGRKWLPDPTTRWEERYWDGDRWTALVRGGGQQGEDPVDLGSPDPTWQAQLDNERIHEIRAQTLAGRYGVTVDEATAVCIVCPCWTKPKEIAKHVALLRADPASLSTWQRLTHDKLVEALETAKKERAEREAAPVEATQAPAADWYPDPAGRHQLRYWDGAAWTEHVADQGAQTVDALT